MEIKTAGDLRGFLANVLVGIRNGSVDVEEANAIAKVSAQINQSLAVEVNTAIQLQKMGKDHPVAGSMMLTSGTGIPEALPDPETWCAQCERRVTQEKAGSCTMKHCKGRV